MSLALKRILPKLYQKLKSIKNKIPANVEFWDKKKYKVTNKINDLFKPWKTWDALIKESDFVFKNYNGGDFIDVGAFAGFYSFLLAPKSNPFDNFVSCEPDANVKINLLENLAILTNTFNKLRIRKNKSIKKVIGINELTKYLNNQIKLKQAKELIAIKTRQYAKRQTTWAKSKMIKWTKIEPHQLSSNIKKITKSSLKLDQLI